MTTPGNQEILVRLDQIERHLGDRIGRLEVAMMGDEAMGHRGVAGRVEKLESTMVEAPVVHQLIEDRAKQARADIHKRVDSIESEWTRFKYFSFGVAAGAGLIGGSAGAWLVKLLVG